MSTEDAAHGPAGQDGSRRTHPLTPLLTGWKIFAGVIAVIAAQNLAQLVGEFTVRRALLGLGALVVALVVAVGVSALIWWRTTYEISSDGVTRRSGLLTRTGRTAPRERIESVSVERPAVPRLLGLAKVRVEFAGGSESHLDIAYITAADAETIRTEILDVAAGGPAGRAGTTGVVGAAAGGPVDGGPAVDGTTADDLAAGDAPGTPAQAPKSAEDGMPGAPARDRGLRESLREVAYDGVTDGDLIAQIPTTRLLHAMLRDVGWLIGLVVGVVWIIVTAIIAWRTDGAGTGLIAAALPAIVAVPQAVLHRLEGGWGFVSRDTDRGLRMRRGLFSTRTDNLGAGRVQDLRLRRPLLWRGPAWTEARVSVAGIGEDDSSAATSALPVGTREELLRTLGHLLPTLGTEDDAALLDRLLTARARDLGGIGPRHRLFFIGRRTRRVLLLRGALVLRSGVITAKVQIVPRERIQGLALAQGPVGRMTSTATLTVGVAAARAEIAGVDIADVLELEDALRPDAAQGRRYRDRDDWPRPPLGPDAHAPSAPAPAIAPDSAPAPVSTPAPAPGDDA
ncbi:PH domain-containing protein [Brachybacterium halotolerans subsp. kimchii]|uniref:PH domain-containing protein n=1 Tax=Brachybacterium halotolerans TaxID=2795215 RepID=UPI001E640F11|nr:PH domain-containing protein [Brachybacterium halotolerans]UEJ83482.1 PH domain-containing protein [Brachybacterium halotolerans subsp. kimchii]